MPRWMRNPFRHHHDPKPIAVQHANLPASLLGGGGATMPNTIVLYRCSCGHAFSNVMAGEWTLQQIAGEQIKQSVDALLNEVGDR